MIGLAEEQQSATGHRALLVRVIRGRLTGGGVDMLAHPGTPGKGADPDHQPFG